MAYASGRVRDMSVLRLWSSEVIDNVPDSQNNTDEPEQVIEIKPFGRFLESFELVALSSSFAALRARHPKQKLTPHQPQVPEAIESEESNEDVVV